MHVGSKFPRFRAAQNRSDKSFSILMIACVMTLESRDKHARIIHEVKEPKGSVRRKLSKRFASIFPDSSLLIVLGLVVGE